VPCTGNGCVDDKEVAEKENNQHTTIEKQAPRAKWRSIVVRK
jgi:hypothetical protein